MTESNPVYLKIDYGESLESKKDILFLEISLLKVMKIIQRYQILREGELKIKNKMNRSIKELGTKVRRTYSCLPPMQFTNQMKRKEKKKESEINLDRTDQDLEEQLREIQEKLKMLEV